MIRRTVPLTAWLAAALVVALPRLGEAQSAGANANVAVNFTSSMSAACVGGVAGTAYAAYNPCEVIRFGLHIPMPQVTQQYTYNAQTVNEAIRWVSEDIRSSTQISSSSTLYRFAQALKIYDFGTTYFTSGATGNLWRVSGLTGSQLSLTETALRGNWAQSPLFIEMRMSTYQAGLDQIGAIGYTASGKAVEEAGRLNRTADWSTAGQVSRAGTTGGTVTPEPASMLLLGTGLAGIAARRRRRNAQPAV